MLTLGLDLSDLGTPDLPWRRFRAVVEHLPPTSALARSMHGEKALWSTTEHLLAAAVDALSAANWQRGGGKGKRPKPVPRPGDQEAKASKTMGTGRRTIEDARAFYNRVNRRTRPVDISTARVCERCERTDIHARGLCSKHYQQWRRER